MNEIKTEGKKVKVTKIEAVRMPGAHPNGINEGFEQEGEAYTDVVEGEYFSMSGFRTSKVLEVSSYNTFKTKNSVYQIEVAA